MRSKGQAKIDQVAFIVALVLLVGIVIGFKAISKYVGL
jgi:hypothetical protein